MKISNNFIVTLIIILSTLLVVTTINLFISFRPLLDYVYYIEKQHPLPILLSSIIISTILTFVLIDRKKNNRSRIEKTKMFVVIIHTVQDIMQKSSSRLQNVLLDMEEFQVNKKLIDDVKECLDENIKLIYLLSELDPEQISKQYDKNLESLVLKLKKTKN